MRNANAGTRDYTVSLVDLALANDRSIKPEQREMIMSCLSGQLSKLTIKQKTLNFSQSAKWIGVSRPTFLKLVKAGAIRPVMLGETGIKRYRIDDLERLISAREVSDVSK
ncbi:MAG TPA: helix-turn-helix domain-containing protein [bacterium]|nr:helix-turn-helix domain-containing protein [bacterium]